MLLIKNIRQCRQTLNKIIVKPLRETLGGKKKIFSHIKTIKPVKSENVCEGILFRSKTEILTTFSNYNDIITSSKI